MTNELWWYVARSCGLVSWALLAASVLWGLAVSGRLRNRTVKRAWLLDLHRHLGGLAVVFVGLHIAGLLCDKYVHFGPAAVFVPLASTWRPGAVAWGVAGLYLLVAVEATSLARRLLPRRVWRATHVLSYPLLATATVHLLQAGTEAHIRLVQVTVATLCTLVVAATVARVATAGRRQPVRSTTARIPAMAPAGHELMSPRTRPADRFERRGAQPAPVPAEPQAAEPASAPRG